MPPGIYKRKPRPISPRFFKKVFKQEGDGCWIWNGSIEKSGYGRFRFNGKPFLAHRASWEIHNGPIPKGEGYHGTCVCHKCDNKICVNPSHLFLGSQSDNMRDLLSKGMNPHSRLKPEQVIEIRSSNYSSEILSKNYGVNKLQIQRIKRGIRWKFILPEKDRIRVDSTIIPPRNKLSVNNVHEILNSNEKQKDLAKKFGVRQSAISKIKNGINLARLKC